MQCIMYLTTNCSLCDEALTFLIETSALSGSILTTVDIATDDVLLDRFAERIPVLKIGDTFLDWPYDVSQIKRLVKSEKSASIGRR